METVIYHSVTQQTQYVNWVLGVETKYMYVPFSCGKLIE